MSKVMKLTIKLTSLETSYGEIMSIRDSISIPTDVLPLATVEKLKALLREDDIFSVSIEAESGIFDGYIYEG